MGLSFIVNVVCNGSKETVAAFAGDFEQAHLAGVSFLNGLCRMQVEEEAGIVITGNGGFPLDQNIYQAVKGISTGRYHLPQGRGHYHGGSQCGRPWGR